MDAILVVDMLNDFVTGSLKCDRARRIIPNLRKLAVAARKADVPVIYCNDSHLKSDFELKVWGAHAMRGTKGAEVIPELKPEKEDYQVPKRTYSCFFETELDTILRAHDARKIIITGLHTNICDRHTTADAFFRGYEPIIPDDGVEAMDEQAQQQGLEYLKNIYGAKIVNAEDIVKKWK
jgi:nicotinamidase-related amidase